ncbi:MAG: hypothetical protein QXS68_04145 [Candidatus Methanomethylicaceae archaeon]
MPKKGFKSITLSEDLYKKLLELAERYGTTPQGIIKIAASDEKFTIKKPLHGGGRRFESGSAHHEIYFIRILQLWKIENVSLGTPDM